MDPIASLDDLIEEPKPRPHRIRLLLMQLAITLAFALLAVQLYKLQIVEGEQFRDKADNNRFREAVVDAPRGIIYDRNGIVLVRNTPAYIVAIIPADLPRDPEPVYRRLGKLLGMDAAGIRRLVEPKPRGERLTDAFTPVPIKTVEPTVAYTVDERHLELPGAHVRVAPLREYLDGPLIAHLLGYVGRITAEQYAARKGDAERRYGMNDHIGQAGLEEVYEETLRGRPGLRTMEVDAAGREVRALAVESPIPGRSLKLSIDLPLQREMTRILAEELPKRQSMVGIAMDPRNGQILALVALPTYDNNLFVRGLSDQQFATLMSDPGRPLVNHAISDVYPPGSTFKMFTAPGALQEGVVTESTQVYDPGFLAVEGARFPCWGVHGWQDMVSGLADSCDTYFYTIGGGDPRGKVAGLGVARIKKWAMLFGLGAPTGIDLPNEQAGHVPDEAWKERTYKERWYLGDTYNMSIGQGFVTSTPLQILNGNIAVANGGTLYKPQLVLEELDDTGIVTSPFQPQIIRQVPVAPQHLQTVREGLRAGMTIGTTRYGTKYYGTSWDSEVPDVRMGGKTGTAEYGLPDAQGKLATHGWFSAFAPWDNPEIAILVFEENGSGRYAANTVAKIMRWYFRVPPEKRGPGGF